MKTKKIFRKIFVGACSLVMGVALAGGVVTAYNGMQENATITADAADLGVVKIETHSADRGWLADDNKRILFQLPSSVPVGTNYTMQSGTISLIRGGNTWTSNYAFTLQTSSGWGQDAFIGAWPFGNYDNTYNKDGTFIFTTGDRIVIDATFSNGTDSFSINATVIVNSTTTGDMYVEEPAIDAGYGCYAAEWNNSWTTDDYYPQMHITANEGIPAGAYKQVNADAITFTRNGTTYNLQAGDYLTIGADNGGVQQVDFTLWPLGNSLGVSYEAQEGDILTVDGKFTNGTVTFEIQKTEIINLVGKPKVHSVVPVYTVNYTNADGKEVSSVEARHNETLEKPADAVKEQAGWVHEFAGWYNGDTKWDFSSPVTSNMTLKPKFNSYIMAGAGREYNVSTGNSGWTQSATKVLFSMDTNAVPEWTSYTAVESGAIKIIRGDTVYNGKPSIDGGNGAEYQLITKRNANTYVIDVSEWTFGTACVQDGDMIVIDGLFTQSLNPTTYFKIDQTIINISIDGEGVLTTNVSNDLYKATFEYDGATYAMQTVVSGGKLTEPTPPTKEADSDYTYEFDGWYNGNEKWDFANDTLTEDVTLVAIFNAKAKEVIEAGYGYNESIKTASTGFYFKLQANSVPYDGWSVRYKPMTVDAIKKIRDGVTTNVGNLGAETIVKYDVNGYYVEAWAVGNWQDGDIFVLNGKFKNESNGTIFSISETYIQITVNDDGEHTDTVLNPTITFLDADDNEISKKTIAYNSLISEPASVPAKAEDDENKYTFSGWYNGDTRWNFSTDIPNGDVTLKPKYNAISKYATYTVENVVTAVDKVEKGFYFYAETNDAPFSAGWGLRYIPTTKDAIVKISADGTRTNVGNTAGETIVKYAEDKYYIEAWAIGGYEDGATYILNGTFKNVANQAMIAFNNVSIKLSVVEENKVTASVMRTQTSMVSGASIRLTSKDGNMGIRFEAELGYEYDETAQYYVMIVPVSYLKAFNITSDYYTALVNALAAAGKEITVATMECLPFQYTAEELAVNGRNVGSYYIRGSLTNVRYENINTKFIGIGYMVKDGVYTYLETDIEQNARSLAEVASKALSDKKAYPDGNSYLEGFVRDSFTQVGGAASGTYSLSKTHIEGYPVQEQLSIVGIPAGADVTAVWSSSNPSVAAVDQKGNVIGMASGEATITAIFLGKEYTCNVTNMAGAKVELVKDGSIVSWAKLANVQTYAVRVVDEYGDTMYEFTTNNTVVDLTKLGLATGTKYVLSICADLNGVLSSATKLAFTYDDYNVNYVMAEEGESLSVGVWNGSYHFNDYNKIKELADAGINLIIGVNPVWHSSEASWIAVLDKAYEYGVSIIADPRGWSGSAYTAWDGTLPEYGKHPAITGFMAYDEPVHIGKNVNSNIFNVLDEAQAKFNSEKAKLGRDDLIFFINILGASGIAGNAGNNTYNYETGYVDPYLNAVDADVISMDSYSLLKNGTTSNIRKSYYYTFDVLSKKAKDNGTEFWYTLLSSAHKAGDGSNYTYSEPTEEELRWQMAVGMVFGAKNLSHYTYTSDASDYSTMVEYGTWNTTALYDRVKKVDGEYANWSRIYNSFTWQGYAALDFGQTSNYKANALMQNLSYDVAVNEYGGLSSVAMSDGSSSTDSKNNAKDLLVGMFKDDNGNMAFMLTNAASAVNNYSTSNKYYANLAYSMVDIGTTLTFEAGYVGAIVIKNGVKTYHTLNNNQLTLTVGAWEGVFVIPVKAQTQLSKVTGLTENAGVITWNAVENANAYEVVVIYNGEEIINTTVTDTTFTMDRLLGDYTITVHAKNDGKYQKSNGMTI